MESLSKVSETQEKKESMIDLIKWIENSACQIIHNEFANKQWTKKQLFKMNETKIA